MEATSFAALAKAMEATEEETSQVIDRLAILGFHVVAAEELHQLRDSYHKMLAKYYEADAALHRLKRTMLLVLDGRIPEEGVFDADDRFELGG
jgi:hypothetical protein